MPKCGCAGSTCACKVTGTGGVTVTGTGTAQDPYVVEIDGLEITGLLTVDDTTSVDLTILGDGTEGDPFVLSAVVNEGDVVVSTPTNGGTTNIGDTENAHVFNHGATIAGHTINFPDDSSALKKEVTIFADKEITALTVTSEPGTTVVNPPDSIAEGTSFTMRLVGTTWRVVGVWFGV